MKLLIIDYESIHCNCMQETAVMLAISLDCALSSFARIAVEKLTRPDKILIRSN